MGTLKSQYQIPKVYALKNTSKIRENSQSGGAFTAFSDAVLSQGGVVYGCTLSEDFLAVHIRAVNSTDRDLMRGSKYIQSDLQDAFIRAKKDLDNGLQVLFTGTPCQIAGLRAFLGKAYDNLLIIDIVCNGVPSPKVWKSYLHWLEEKNKSSLYQTIFRDKKFGWKSSVETYVFTNGKVSNSKSFNRLFYKHLTVRPSCFSCPYKHIVHPGDITIGDFWGIDKAVPGYKDSKGVSLIMVNNSRGGYG